MKTTREHYVMEEDASTCLTTTIYDLMTALHAVVEPHEDVLVVALVAHWLQTGRITLLGKVAARRLRRRTAMATRSGAGDMRHSVVVSQPYLMQ